MGVHEDLRTLVTRDGARVLDAADDLRAAMVQFLEEGRASSAEIDRLVDAVRFGAYQQMLSALDHGADPRTAVEGAGVRLAAERGGDRASASWACATLGYAVGRVPETIVLLYRTGPHSAGSDVTPRVSGEYGSPPPQTAPAPWSGMPSGQPTQPPHTGQPQPTPPPNAGQPPEPVAYGPAAASAPPQLPGYPATEPPPGGPSDPAAPPPQVGGGRRTALIGVGVAFAALAVVAVVAAVVLGSQDAPEGTNPPAATTPTPTEEPFDRTYTPQQLTESYSALGEQVGEGAHSCERSEPENGQSELVRCTYSQLEVLFATYVGESALEDARSGIEEESAAQTYELDMAEEDDAGVWHLASDPSLDETWMYWDSTDALQSAYVSDTTDHLPSRAAQTFFDQRGATDAARAFPDPLAPFESAALWEMAKDYVGEQAGSSEVDDCERSRRYEGDVESVTCTDGDYTLFFYQKDSIESLEAEREDVSDDAVSDTSWNWFRGEPASYPTSGHLVKTVVDEQAVVYWDDTGQLLTAYVYGPDKRMNPVVDYWAGGE